MSKIVNKNQKVADEIDKMNLSERARNMVDSTEIVAFAEMFGGLTEEQLEEMALEYSEEEND